MSVNFLETENLPFCKGCSHHLIARATEKALAKVNLNPLDVVFVSDIGCHGIIDRNFNTHTVHGLHGRSVALGAGISAALGESGKKIVVFIGDGGSTIGLNHIIGAAHRNFNMTVVVHNNMLYGMTGGQPSDLTPNGFNTRSSMTGLTEHYLDLFSMVKTTGAAYVSRIVAKGDFSDQLAEAFSVNGFALVEVLEICPSYGVKYNQGVTLKDIDSKFNIPLETYKNPHAQVPRLEPRTGIKSLLDTLERIPKEYDNQLREPLTVVIGGSAGEGVQAAAEIFASAAAASGLQVTKKGSYPVTVGIGFSAVELILSRESIQYTGSRKIDWAIIASQDGLNYYKKRLENMTSGHIIMEEQLTAPESGAAFLTSELRRTVGPASSGLLGLAVLLAASEIFPLDAFIRVLSQHKISQKLDMEMMKNKALEIAGRYAR